MGINGGHGGQFHLIHTTHQKLTLLKFWLAISVDICWAVSEVCMASDDPGVS